MPCRPPNGGVMCISCIDPLSVQAVFMALMILAVAAMLGGWVDDD